MLVPGVSFGARSASGIGYKAKTFLSLRVWKSATECLSLKVGDSVSL